MNSEPAYTTTDGPAGTSALTGRQAFTHALDKLTAIDARFGRIPSTGSPLRQLTEIFGKQSAAAIRQLVIESAIGFDMKIYATIPILRPYAIRDRSKRGGKNKVEGWGTPTLDGYFCDDNSLIKRLPQRLTIRSDDPRFNGRRVAAGWTACHAWRTISDGRQASRYGSLNSFVPVLTWVPTALARATDIEGSAPQSLLKSFAFAYKRTRPPDATRPYISRRWQLLDSAELSPVETTHRFAYDEGFVRNRVTSIYKVSVALSDVTQPSLVKTLSSRYTTGLRSLDPKRAQRLSAALRSYAESIEQAAGFGLSCSYDPFPE